MQIHTFETTFTINTSLKALQNDLKNAGKNKWQTIENGMISWILGDDGILITTKFLTKSNVKKRFVHYRINPIRVFKKNNYIELFDTKKFKTLCQRVNRLLQKISKSLPRLESTSLSRIDFAFQVNFGSDSSAAEYVKSVKRGKTPKGFHLDSYYDKKSKRLKTFNNSFTITSDNYCGLSIYNKGQQMKDQSDFFPISETKKANGLVRFEIRCLSGKLKSLKKKYDISDISHFFEIAEKIGIDLFAYYLPQITGTGFISTLQEARSYIKKCVNLADSKKELLTEFLKKSNIYRNSDDAYEDMCAKYGKKEIKKILNTFDDIGISFTTITQRTAKNFPIFPTPYQLLIQNVANNYRNVVF